MDRKKEIKQLYKETPIEAGVYQIKNVKNNKVFIGSTRNIRSLNGVRFTLETGSHMNRELQTEWNLFGRDTFRMEVLETLKKKDEPYFNEKEALSELENKWMEKLQPYGERGYNKKKPEV